MGPRLASLSTLGLSILAACGSVDDTEQGSDAAAYVQFGGDTYRVIDLGLDATTYSELTAPFGEVAGVADTGPSTSEARDLRIRIDAHAPASIFDFLLASSTPPPGSSLHTSFGVLLGGGTKATALLLPAVQKIQSVSVEEDGSMTIEIAAVGTIQSIDGGIPQEAGGVQVAVGDVNGLMSGAQAGQLVGSRIVASPYFEGTDDGLTSSAVVLARPGTIPTWFDFETPVALAVDIRAPGGAILHRFRIESAMPQPDDGLDITLAPAKAAYLKIKDIDPGITDDAEEAALLASSYMSFSSRSYVAARSKLQAFTAIDPSGGTPTFDEVVAYWTAERAATITALHDAVAHAADLEGLLCQAAVPVTGSLATALAAMPLTDDSAPAIATVYEATHTLRDPVAGAYAGGPLAIASLATAGTSPAADAAPACRALVEVAPFADALVASGAVDANAAYLNQASTLAQSPRSLDRDLVAWIELVDSIVAGTAVDNNAARAAAKAKADILIESLNDHEQAAKTRFDLAHLLVD